MYEGKPFGSCWWFLMQLYVFFTATQKPHAKWQSADGGVIKTMISIRLHTGLTYTVLGPDLAELTLTSNNNRNYFSIFLLEVPFF